jgi:hypothetical protein
MCRSRYQLDSVEELSISQLNIAVRIARRVVKFLDLVMLRSPSVVLAENVADDGMKITLLVPSCCCGPKTDTMPLSRPSGNLMPLVLISTFSRSDRLPSSRSFVSASARDRMILRPSYSMYGYRSSGMAP